MPECEVYTVRFDVKAPTMHGHATYDVNAESAESAVSVARRRAAKDLIPTYTAYVTVSRGGVVVYEG